MRLSLLFEWSSRVTGGKHFKVVKRNWLVTNEHMFFSKETCWSQMGTWSLTAVDSFYLDRLFVKGEISHCSPTLTLK